MTRRRVYIPDEKLAEWMGKDDDTLPPSPPPSWNVPHQLILYIWRLQRELRKAGMNPDSLKPKRRGRPRKEL